MNTPRTPRECQATLAEWIRRIVCDRQCSLYIATQLASLTFGVTQTQAMLAHVTYFGTSTLEVD